jgi:hypothetical protein
MAVKPVLVQLLAKSLSVVEAVVAVVLTKRA